MLKLIVNILALINGVLMCRWVCIDNNNIIKRYNFNPHDITLEWPKHEIIITDVTGIPDVKKVSIPGESQVS